MKGFFELRNETHHVSSPEEALRSILTRMFTSQNDRPQNPNIAVFFTNGRTNEKQQLFEAANQAKARGGWIRK